MATGDYDSDVDLDLITADGISSKLGYVRSLKNNWSGDFILFGSDGPVTCCPPHGTMFYTYFGNINLNEYDNDGDCDITGASILPGQSGDTVKISAGQNGGHFVLYYVTPVCGTYPSCSKHIYVVNPNAITCTIYSYGRFL